jgi:serine/threonine-protein kinase
MRLNVELGGAQTLAPINAQFGDAAVLSPDGTVLAFVANASPEERSRIHVRRLDQLTATPLSGTEDAVIPFFSPDGRSLAFFARGTLKTIALAGGTAVSLAPAPDQRGGAWAADGTIVFAPNKAAGTGLLRISSLGGTPEALNALDEGEVIQLWPQVLPGGRAVLYTSGSVPGSYNDASLVVQALPDGPRTIVHRGGFHGRYLASGHLVYIHDGTLFAVPFDLRRLQKTGPPVAVVENVASNTVTGGAQFSVSDSGTLLFLSGPSIGTGIPLEWMDRTGATMPLRAKPANWFAVRFSPDGNRLALEIRDESADIWIYELTRGRLTRLTSNREQDNMPVWTPDARRLTYASARGDGSTLNLYWQRADGTGTAERLTTSGNAQQPTSWHPGGRFLAFDERTTRNRIMILPLDGNEQSGWKAGIPVPFSNSAAHESEGVFSPDGRWLAYSSNDTGRPEIYVRPFPGPGARAAVSAEGGMHPTWSHDGRQLFFGNHGQIMVAPVIATEGSFETEKPRLWSGGRYQTRGPNRMFDLHPDGRFALASDRAAEVKHDHVVLMLNFFDELRRIAPPSD